MYTFSSYQKVLITLSASITGLILYYLFKDDDDDDFPRDDLITSRQTIIEVKIPKDVVGAIIGRQGANIRKVQEDTGARINFKDSTINEEDQRVAVIRGSAHCAQHAEQIIQQMIADQPVIITSTMFVPHKSLGRIIGRNGDVIRQLCRTSEAKITIDRTDTLYPNNTKMITLKGSAKAISSAKFLIEEKVGEEQMFQSRSAVLSANKPHPKQNFQNGSHNLDSNSPKDQMSSDSVLPSEKKISNSSVEDQCTDTSFLSRADSRNCWPNYSGHLEVYVSAVDTPQHFWVQVLTPDSLQLEEINRELTRLYPVTPPIEPGAVSEGDLVAAHFFHDEMCYRARVDKVLDDGKRLDLYFVDYGDSEEMECSFVRDLPHQFRTLQFQALECSLANVIPPESGWSDEACTLFEQLTHTAKWKVVLARTLGYRNTTADFSMPYVELVDTSTERDVYVGLELVKAGHAVWSDKIPQDLPIDKRQPDPKTHKQFNGSNSKTHKIFDDFDSDESD